MQVPAMSGNLLLWCLYTAAVAGNISDMMRFWIVGKLKAIAETMGIRNALGLVKVLSKKREVTVVSLKGSLCLIPIRVSNVACPAKHFFLSLPKQTQTGTY